jgi:hypothetical protein
MINWITSAKFRTLLGGSVICCGVLLFVACTKSNSDASTTDTLQTEPADTLQSPAPDTTRTSAVETPTAPVPAETFSLISPTAGDTLVEGRTYIVRWTAGSVKHINLGAAMGGHDKGLLVQDAPAHPDSLRWKVPVGFVTGFGPPSSDQIRLRLENADSTNQWVESKPFVIAGAARR